MISERREYIYVRKANTTKTEYIAVQITATKIAPSLLEGTSSTISPHASVNTSFDTLTSLM